MLSPEELQIVEFGKKNGKSASEVANAVASYRASKIEKPKEPTTVGSRVMESVKGSLTQAKEQIMSEGASADVSAPTRGFQLAATATGLPVKAVMSALPESVQTGLSKVGQFIAKPIQWLGDKIGDIKGLQDFVTKNPQAAKVVEELAQIGQATSETGGNIAAIQGGITTGKNIVSGTEQAISKTADVVQKGTELAKTGYDATKGFVAGARDVIKPIIQEAKTLPAKAKANIAQTRATEATIQSLKPAGQVAVRSGVELADVKSLYNISKNATPQLKKLVKVTQDFASGKSKVNPFEVVGKPIVQGLKMAQDKASTIGSKLSAVADDLPNFSPANLKQGVFNGLKKVRGLEGLEITPKGLLNFKNTTLATAATKADRIAIQKIFNDAIKNSSAKSKHLLRQELFEVLGGKKKAGIQLTGTQEAAYEAVRKSLADALDNVSPTYKALNMQYAKAVNPIKKLQDLLKTTGVDEDLLNMKAGLLARRLTSFSKSNPEIRQILRDLDNVISTKGKTLLKTEQLQDFYNILDKYYDIAGQTGFQGQVTAGVSKALEKGGLSKGVAIVENQVGKVLGETDIVKQKALEEILKEILK